MSLTGTVERYDRKRGFGFIKPESGGKSIFVHWSEIQSDDQWPSLKRGMEVSYDISEDDERRGQNKEIAVNVTDTGGGNIQIDEREEDQLSSFKCKGTVKFFAKKGYGFITCDQAIKWPQKLPAGSDIYVSREDIVIGEGSVCNLSQGMRVQFKVCQREGQDGLAAAQVCNEDGSPIELAPRDREEKGSGKGNKGSSGKNGKSKGGAKGKSSSRAPEKYVQKTIVKPISSKSSGKGQSKSSSGKSKGKGKR